MYTKLICVLYTSYRDKNVFMQYSKHQELKVQQVSPHRIVIPGYISYPHVQHTVVVLVYRHKRTYYIIALASVVLSGMNTDLFVHSVPGKLPWVLKNIV